MSATIRGPLALQLSLFDLPSERDPLLDASGGPIEATSGTSPRPSSSTSSSAAGDAEEDLVVDGGEEPTGRDESS